MTDLSHYNVFSVSKQSLQEIKMQLHQEFISIG